MERSARGMTLIEIMIAVAVLAIAIVGLLTAMPVATQATRDAEENEIARHAIENQIAAIRGAGDTWEDWAHHAAADGETGHPFSVDELESVQEGVECGLVSGQPGEDLTRQVTVSVNWRGIDGAERDVVVTTLVAIEQ